MTKRIKLARYRRGRGFPVRCSCCSMLATAHHFGRDDVIYHLCNLHESRRAELGFTTRDDVTIFVEISRTFGHVTVMGG